MKLMHTEVHLLPDNCFCNSRTPHITTVQQRTVQVQDNRNEQRLVWKCLCWPAAAKNSLLLFCTFVFANKKKYRRAWKQGEMRRLIKDWSEFSKSRFYTKREPHQKWNQLLESLFCRDKN